MKKLRSFISTIKNFLASRKAAKAARADKPKSKWGRRLRKAIWAVVLTGALTVFFVGLAALWYAFIYLDDEFDLSTVDSTLNYTSVVYAMRDGKYVECETLHSSEDRIWVDIETVPKNLSGAFIAIEDKRFYQHSGVDLRRTASAILNFVNFSSNSTYGGSTITQQVIKNLSGDDEQTVTRKIQEIRRAWYLEREYKKDQILEVYLNTIYLSQGCYGVETAAETYFGKTVENLSLLECASLAAITKYPTKYDPIQNPENNLERAHVIIDEMLDQGKITQEEADAAKAEELKLHVGEKAEGVPDTPVNSYFVDAVITDAVNALVNEKGYSRAYANSLLYSGGLQIYSTMDLDVQESIDRVYKDRDNFPDLTAKGEPIQSAIMVIDNETGAVVGMYGGIGEKKVALGLNRAIGSYRQPGSCIKPIGTYGPAIEYGATIDGVRIAPGTLVQDKGVRQYHGALWPKNYDGVGTEKLMSVQTALDRSVNTVAVRVNNALGARTAFSFLKNNLGVTSLVEGSGSDENDQAMALGGLTNGISVKEITAAYSSFATGGTYTKPYTFTKICDSNGRVLLENRVESSKAMQKNTAALMNKMLQHAASHGTGSVANFGTTAICGKTGTTSDDKDRWFVGYTRYYTAAVWVGFDIPSEIHWYGINPAASAWRKVMSRIHDGLEWKSFEQPAGLVSVEVCAETGKLKNENCKTSVTGEYFSSSVPAAVCDVCGVFGKDPTVLVDPATLPPAPTPDPNGNGDNPNPENETKPEEGGETVPGGENEPEGNNEGGETPDPNADLPGG